MNSLVVIAVRLELVSRRLGPPWAIRDHFAETGAILARSRHGKADGRLGTMGRKPWLCTTSMPLKAYLDAAKQQFGLNFIDYAL
jgi:hypothetical protein